MIKNVPIFIISTIWLLSGCEKAKDSAFTGSGTIEATEIRVSAKTAGQIKQITFDEGDTATKGIMLAEIDVESIKLQRDVTAAGLAELEWNEKILHKDIDTASETVKQASITLANLRKTHDRITGLFKENAASREQVDKAEMEFALAESRLHASQKNLESLKTRIKLLEANREKIMANLKLFDYKLKEGKVLSPTDGVIVEKYVEQGEIVNFGTPICTIADLSSVWLIIYIGEELLGKIHVGDTSRIRVDSHPDRDFNGTVTWISPQAEFTPKNVQTKDSRVDLVYSVKITIENRSGIFKIGMPAEAYIEEL